MLYVNYSPDGSLLGFYTDDIHELIPDPHIKLTNEEWQDCVNNPGLRKVDSGAKKIIVFTPPPPVLDDVKASKFAEINAAADAALASVTSAYPDSERTSWDKQETEARAWLLDGSTATPLLDGIIAGRGMDKATLVGKVIAKADAFAMLAGGVFGQRQAFEDTVLSATTVAEVNAISISFGA
jgi:hypothetical protein